MVSGPCFPALTGLSSTPSPSALCFFTGSSLCPSLTRVSCTARLRSSSESVPTTPPVPEASLALSRGIGELWPEMRPLPCPGTTAPCLCRGLCFLHLCARSGHCLGQDWLPSPWDREHSWVSASQRVLMFRQAEDRWPAS